MLIKDSSPPEEHPPRCLCIFLSEDKTPCTPIVPSLWMAFHMCGVLSGNISRSLRVMCPSRGPFRPPLIREAFPISEIEEGLSLWLPSQWLLICLCHLSWLQVTLLPGLASHQRYSWTDSISWADWHQQHFSPGHWVEHAGSWGAQKTVWSHRWED